MDAEAEGEPIEVLEAYESALELDPNSTKALFQLGALNVQFGLVEEAGDFFRRALDADPEHSAAAACLRLLDGVDATGLDAEHATSIDAARAEDDAEEAVYFLQPDGSRRHAGFVELVPIEVARRTPVKRIQGFLSDAEIKELTATAAAVRAEVGVVERPTRGGGWNTVYLNAELGRRLPWLRERLLAAVSDTDQELWGSVLTGKTVNLRCAEYHTVTPPGNLAYEQHLDHGSLITIDIMLSTAPPSSTATPRIKEGQPFRRTHSHHIFPRSDFDGGGFETSEPGDYMLSHPFEKGDLLLFLSHKYHSVAPVTGGIRNVLVAEFWEGDEREPADGRCDVRYGPCAPPDATNREADLILSGLSS